MSKLLKLGVLKYFKPSSVFIENLARTSSTATRVCSCGSYVQNIKRRQKEQQTYRQNTQLYSSTTTDSLNNSELSVNKYEEISEETLQSLSDKFDLLAETKDCDPEYDVTYADGVLTVKISDKWGTYVINKQSPNKQIWLSSPISGPKRYDFTNGTWIYSHDGGALHQLLTEEISQALSSNIDFSDCEYSNR
ncbi:frataxin, mitochondrial-like [Mytilus californianus]|uniref:frataxin, mitochondrial-like n=1 Tax=Mytilus californianus TaxID=6549 RepID=UPI0022483DBD|nr:frataxin, mitochondrial-like [Mytilus californianus]